MSLLDQSFRSACMKPTQVPISSLNSGRSRRNNLSRTLGRPLDRVNVLGDDSTYGHTGCVNALSWARDGEMLLTGGDDTTVRIWYMDPANTSQEYPFVCRSVIQTGHRANIFSVQMLPHSSRIATVAGDKQVRVLDLGEQQVATPDNRETHFSSRQSCKHILRCHQDRVKRIVTEHSPDLFLSVGEDGSVRQHDLRTPHDCRRGSCPTPLAKVNHELSTLSLSPLTPYQFVVAGESPYGYMFDRRHAGRFLQEEWGVAPNSSEDLTTCVRRFGRPKKSSGGLGARPEHITGARMSSYNGHELLLSYSGDGVYLYSTADDPDEESVSLSSSSPILPANAKRRKLDDSEFSKNSATLGDGVMDVDDESLGIRDLQSNPHSQHDHINDVENDNGDDDADDTDDEDDDDDSDDQYLEFTNLAETDESAFHPQVPVILPRMRFAGSRNVATIKDVNYLGPSDEFVTSGSDDGNFFIWRKATGALHGIYEGDSSVVNMVEGHPHLPLVAVSGIDTTIKLFAPTSSPSKFSKLTDAQHIIETNKRLSRARTMRYNFATILAEARIAMGAHEADLPECRSQ